MEHTVTGTQLRQARDMARLSMADLAYLADASKSNVHRLEAFGDAPVQCRRTMLRAIVQVLKLNGVVIDGAGVRTIPKEFTNGQAHEGRPKHEASRSR